MIQVYRLKCGTLLLSPPSDTNSVSVSNLLPNFRWRLCLSVTCLPPPRSSMSQDWGQTGPFIKTAMGGWSKDPINIFEKCKLLSTLAATATVERVSGAAGVSDVEGAVC
ncbi:hypothetical protein CY34DRAFT_480311 [Suillus luteus UH-Slu-Lm8-n1]|uniref:Uncharacterized protein n=1 Tax=Suillus luteus UH-Slu-Lm8-n1 TaxID=930992 RepID=A0A0D0AS28_9AGAM|nr:hypothetical protein CY34DRAFT_480311 [Suillus luteus UH-Slu-Lm8-n1]